MIKNITIVALALALAYNLCSLAVTRTNLKQALVEIDNNQQAINQLEKELDLINDYNNTNKVLSYDDLLD